MRGDKTDCTVLLAQDGQAEATPPEGVLARLEAAHVRLTAGHKRRLKDLPPALQVCARLFSALPACVCAYATLWRMEHALATL